ncbi:hypothetical protein EV127DRAFT_474924 [Xylaria flabelliformis]|nr:hypothetical protein EV127DRAFT_474924 [Xylaria flabelliformis]
MLPLSTPTRYHATRREWARSGGSPMDGGIYVDIQSCKAVWHSDDFLGFPPPDQWLPLELIPRYCRSRSMPGPRTTIKARSFTQHDVEQSVAAFYRLLSSIELRMPPKEDKVAFLSSARATGLSHPGAIQDDEDWPTLILPGIDPVSHDVGRSPNQDVKSFDQDCGFGKFTVNRQSGLYIMPDTLDSDLARFVPSSGLYSACEFRPPCRWPWGLPRGPRLAEVFDHWTTPVEDATWTVDANGICTDHTWFTAHVSMAKLIPPV